MKKETLRKIAKPLAQSVVPVAVVALQTPLHEGVHSLTAKVLPKVSSAGIELNNDYWYAKPLQVITFGFAKAKELPATTGGRALIEVQEGFMGGLGAAVTAAAPEYLSFTLASYWLARGVDNIGKAGKRLYSLVSTVAAYELITHSHAYFKLSATSPQDSLDHFEVAKNLLDATNMPEGAAPYLAGLAGVGMITAGIFTARALKRRKDRKEEKRDLESEL